MQIPWKAAALLVVTLVLAGFVYEYHDSAFPELSPRFELKKSNVTGAADRVARHLGYDPKEYQRVVTFHESTFTKYFLELEYGLRRLKSEVDKGVRVWNWTVRYFAPGRIEELAIRLDTEGRLVGFTHTIPETRKLPRVDRETALHTARDFLREQVPKHPLDKLKLVESSEQEKPGHHIHRFTWERTDWKWGDGTYHVHVSVRGDRVGKYSEHVKIPEAWKREFSRMRSGNRVFQTIAESASAILAVGILVAFILMMTRHQIRWHGFPLLWAVPVGAVLLIAQFSQFPQVLAVYSTEDSFSGFVAQQSLRMAFATFASLVGFAMLAFVADAFWQKAFPQHTPVRALLNGKGLATREALRAVPLGFALAMLSLAYVTGYYMLGRELGLWTPSAIDYSEVLTSYLPSFEALSTGISAAWMEELLFRVLGVVLIYRLTGSRWLAILSTAAIWGFLHSNYPQLPGYARGIELTLEGILLGWVVVRFGILTTFVSHCLFNTWLGAIIAWQTGSPLHMALAVAVSVWPAAIWVKGWRDARRLGRNPEPRELMEGSPPLARQLVESEAILPADHRPAPRSVWALAAGGIVVAAGLAVVVPQSPFSDLGRVHIQRSDAERYADVVLRRRTELQPSRFYRVTNQYAFLTGTDTEYLLEHADLETIAPQVRRHLYQDYWQVKYFKPEQRNTYTVFLHPDGELMLFSRSVAETAPGAKLERDAAIEMAAAFLRKHTGLERDEYEYVSHRAKKQKARRDYRITFESTQWKVGESRLRWTVHLLGDQINGFTPHVKIPEEYTREKDAQGWRDVVQQMLSEITAIAFMLGGLLIVGILIVRHYIPWRAAFLLGGSLVVVYVVFQVNLAPQFFEQYETTQTLANYSILKGARLSVALLATYAGGVALFGILLGLLRWMTGRDAPSLLLHAGYTELRRRWIEGLVLAAAGGLVLWNLDQIALLTRLSITQQPLFQMQGVSLRGFSPGVGIVANALQSALLEGVIAGTFALLAILLWKKHRGLLLLLLLLIVVQDLNVEPEDLAAVGQDLAFQALATGAELWLFIRYFRFNAFAYLFLYFYRALLPAALQLTEKAWPMYDLDIAIVWAAIAAPIVALIVFLRRKPITYAS